jgi:hypothetical protein
MAARASRSQGVRSRAAAGFTRAAAARRLTFYSVFQSIEYAKVKRRQYKRTASEADKVIV